MRHAALLKKEDVLHVFWAQVGHTPERILLSTARAMDEMLTIRFQTTLNIYSSCRALKQRELSAHLNIHYKSQICRGIFHSIDNHTQGILIQEDLQPRRHCTDLETHPQIASP